MFTYKVKRILFSIIKLERKGIDKDVLSLEKRFLRTYIYIT